MSIRTVIHSRIHRSLPVLANAWFQLADFPWTPNQEGATSAVREVNMLKVLRVNAKRLPPQSGISRGAVCLLSLCLVCLLANSAPYPTTQIVSVTPNSGAAGQTLSFAIVGENTHFVQGISKVTVGADITVKSLTVNNATNATANVSISPTAKVGARTVSVITPAHGAEAGGGIPPATGAELQGTVGLLGLRDFATGSTFLGVFESYGAGVTYTPTYHTGPVCGGPGGGDEINGPPFGAVIGGYAGFAYGPFFTTANNPEEFNGVSDTVTLNTQWGSVQVSWGSAITISFTGGPSFGFSISAIQTYTASAGVTIP